MDSKAWLLVFSVILVASSVKSTLHKSPASKNALVHPIHAEKLLFKHRLFQPWRNFNLTVPSKNLTESTLKEGNVTCTCGVFLSNQFKKGSPYPPKGNPILAQDLDAQFPCTVKGTKTCINKCLQIATKHISKSASIICGAVDHDVKKEKAHLFVKNCNDKWVNSNLAAGREYCCRDGEPYKCPLV